MPRTSGIERSRNWSDLTLEEFEDIYPVIEQNAERHFRCATILAEASEHENAVAHLILGSEELIKAFCSLLAAKRCGVKQQSWVGKLFDHHKTRHDLIKDFFSIYLLFNASANETWATSGFWTSVGKVFLNVGIAAGNFLWWKKADNLKQRAFYVDYLGGIVDPAAISIDDYESALRYVNTFKKDIKQFMREIKSASPKQLVMWEKQLDLVKIDQLRKQAYDLQKQINKTQKK